MHTHMTNTRITDPEIFEKRFVVLLRIFFILHTHHCFQIFLRDTASLRVQFFFRHDCEHCCFKQIQHKKSNGR